MAQLDTDVIIIGAGSTGLLLAQGLKRAGINFRIFERYGKDDPSREWSMSLHWGGEFLAKVLPPEILARQGEIDTDPRYDMSKDGGFALCNGDTGEIILTMAGVMPRRVSRKKLKGLMAEGIEIKFDSKLISIDKDASQDFVRAHFANGSSVSARIIVGCDGSRSRVRAIMIDDQALSDNTALPFTLFNFPCSYPKDISVSLRDVHPVFKCGYHPKTNMVHLLAMADATSEDPAQWKHQNLISWNGPPYPADLKTQESRLARLTELSEAWAHPWSTASLNVPKDADIYVDSTSQWDPRKVFTTIDGKTAWNDNEWHGLVTLAGDSAHTMLPHRGQGLNNALEDAAKLLEALIDALKTKSTDLKTAITGYETEMVARGGLEVEVTMKTAIASHNYEMLVNSPMFKHGAHKSK